MVNTNDYVTIYNEAATNDNAFSYRGSHRAGLLLHDAERFDNVNYVKELLQTAPVNLHELSLSGGNESTNFLLLASYFDQKGMIQGTGYSRGNGPA